MTSYHIIYDISCTVSLTSPSLYLKWPPPYLCHHRLCWWSQTNCMYDITSTLRMPSYALYTTSHPLFKTSYHCSYHITSTAFMTSHTRYGITHMAIQTLYLPSDPLYLTLHPLYLCHQPRVSIIPHPLSVWHHTHYMCDIIFSMHAITTTVYDIIPLYV